MKEKKYKCKKFKLVKNDEGFWTIEKKDNMVNFYSYDGKELFMLELPEEDFEDIVQELIKN